MRTVRGNWAVLALVLLTVGCTAPGDVVPGSTQAAQDGTAFEGQPAEPESDGPTVAPIEPESDGPTVAPIEPEQRPAPDRAMIDRLLAGEVPEGGFFGLPSEISTRTYLDNTYRILRALDTIGGIPPEVRMRTLAWLEGREGEDGWIPDDGPMDSMNLMIVAVRLRELLDAPPRAVEDVQALAEAAEASLGPGWEGSRLA